MHVTQRSASHVEAAVPTKGSRGGWYTCLQPCRGGGSDQREPSRLELMLLALMKFQAPCTVVLLSRLAWSGSLPEFSCILCTGRHLGRLLYCQSPTRPSMHGVMSYPPCTARQKWMCFRMDSDSQFNAKGSGCDADFTTSVSMTLSKKKRYL